MEEGRYTHKEKLPVGIDVPELFSGLGMEKYATEMVKAGGDFAIIAFHFLLQVGEYTVRTKESKRCNSSWKIPCFSVRTLKDICVNFQEIHWTKIFCQQTEQLKLDNNENGWKGVCVYQ